MWLSRCAGASLAADKGEGNVLVVWDFDWSLVNENSDTFVLRELAPALTDEMKQLQAERPAIFGKGKWTALMDHLLTKLGEEHMVGRRQIEHCLEGIPVFVEVIQVVRELAADAGVDVQRMESALERGRYEEAIRETASDARGMGISGTPTFVFDRRLAASGAQPVHVLLDAFARAADVGRETE